jgi:ribosomal protein S27E
MSEEGDIPLIDQDGSRPFGSPVIDLGEMRIRFGVPDTTRGRPCEHRDLIYSTKERRVWCATCERTVDSFDAFMTLTRMFHDMVRDWRGKMHKADEALKATIGRRAAKVIDKAWTDTQMAICCPRCGQALLPEDFEHGVSQVSAVIERRRREKLK